MVDANLQEVMRGQIIRYLESRFKHNHSEVLWMEYWHRYEGLKEYTETIHKGWANAFYTSVMTEWFEHHNKAD